MTYSFFMLVGFVLVCELAGGIGSLFTTPAIPTWYAALNKSPLNPPSWVFAPVWTTLYLLMGIAAYLVYRHLGDAAGAQAALWVFVLQLALNVLWSIIFFGLHSPAGGFAVIVLLWLAILWTIILFMPISTAAAWLLAPYLLWVTFASYLNYSVWMLN